MTEEKQLTESQQVESGAAEATASPAFVDDEAWKVLKNEPFAQFIPDNVLKYRTKEVYTIQNWAKENPVSYPAEIEIGSNRGRFMLGLCRARRDVQFYGIELKTSLCRITTNKLLREGLTNGHILNADARLALPILFKEKSVSAIYVLFPDPWWKERHAKRRIMDDFFFNLARFLLVPGGHIVLKTDVRSYYDTVAEYVDNSEYFERIPIEEVPFSNTWELTTRERHCVADGTPYDNMGIRLL